MNLPAASRGKVNYLYSSKSTSILLLHFGQIIAANFPCGSFSRDP